MLIVRSTVLQNGAPVHRHFLIADQGAGKAMQRLQDDCGAVVEVVGYTEGTATHYGIETVPWARRSSDPAESSLQRNLSAIAIDRASLAQLEFGGHTSTNRKDDTQETKLRLMAGIANLEAANEILRAQRSPDCQFI